VDTLGLLVHAMVHPADIQDRDGGILLLSALARRFPGFFPTKVRKLSQLFRKAILFKDLARSHFEAKRVFFPFYPSSISC
jgi:hypothetical protein